MKLFSTKHFQVIALILILCLSACSHSKTNHKLKIAISRERKDIDVRYSTWLEYQKIPMNYINLYPLSIDQAIDSLKKCDALILSGGEDIYPGLFGQLADTIRCGDINRHRDSLEISLYQTAKMLKMPVLGICRGLQMVNVAEGGSLFIDLPTDNNSGELHRIGQEDWAQHYVVFSKDSELYKVIGQDSVLVESNHHQGINNLASPLQLLAHSSDGLAESVGRKDAESGYLLAVQWHPEYAKRTDESSGKIAGLFLQEAEKFRKSKK